MTNIYPLLGKYVPPPADCSDYDEPDDLEQQFQMNREDAKQFLRYAAMFGLGFLACWFWP